LGFRFGPKLNGIGSGLCEAGGLVTAIRGAAIRGAAIRGAAIRGAAIRSPSPHRRTAPVYGYGFTAESSPIPFNLSPILELKKALFR